MGLETGDEGKYQDKKTKEGFKKYMYLLKFSQNNRYKIKYEKKTQKITQEIS